MSNSSPYRIVDFGPYTQSDQAPGDIINNTASPPPPLSQMEAEVDFIANTNFANTIRLYTIDDQQDSLIDYAIQQDGLDVIPSVSVPSWSSGMSVTPELDKLVSTLEALPTSDFSNIPFIVIGNEEISNRQLGGWSEGNIESWIEYVKNKLSMVLPASVMADLKFTTSETYAGQYINLGSDSHYISSNSSSYTATNMGLNADINVIFANINPYFDGVSVSDAPNYVEQIYKTLQNLYPGKEIVISETGWPSSGDLHDTQATSYTQFTAANEQIYWQNFLKIAEQQDISFGAFEAFNEPNKDTSGPTPDENRENNLGLISTNSGPTYTGSMFKTAITSLMLQLLPPGDFNNDGMSDILWRNADGAVDIWTNGDPNQSALIASVDPSWQVAGIGDFNGDGTADILWRNANGLVDIWTNGNPNQSSLIANVSTTWTAQDDGTRVIAGGTTIIDPLIANGTLELLNGSIVGGSITFAAGSAGTLFDADQASLPDTVVGFAEGADYLSFAGEDASNEADAIASARLINGNTLLTFPDHTSLVLVGVTHIDTGIFT